jgi:hypothetical protein
VSAILPPQHGSRRKRNEWARRSRILRVGRMGAGTFSAENSGLRPVIRWPLVGAAVLALALATVTKADPDLWGHVRFGLDTLQARHLSPDDPYSFTQDRPLIDHEWLGEVLMGASYAAAGSSGLALLKGLLAVSALFMVWASLRGTRLEPRMIAFGVVVIGTAQITGTLRPQLWSLLCLAILCLVLVDRRPQVRRLLPLLFVLWANLHGGWIVGLGVLGVWALIDVWVNPKEIGAWAAIMAASVAATLCTPYGWTLWAFMSQTVRITRPMIEDWLPLWSLPAPKWIPWLAVIAVSIWMMRRPLPHRLHSAAVLALLAYASLRIARIEPLLMASAAILLAPYFRDRWPARPRQSPMVPSRDESIAAFGIFIATIVASGWVGSSSLRCIAIEDSERMPDAQAARVLASAGPGRLVTFFNWGEYAFWHLGPRLRVSMDGRREAVYSERRLAEHDAILFGTPNGFATLAEWRPEYVWLPAASGATKQWLATHGYRVEFESPRSFVAVRADVPHLHAPPPAPASAAQCFPG